MVNLTRIYTRTGDDGSTALGDFSRTSKNDPRLVAYADVDETNSVIGVALAHGGLADQVVATLSRVQNDLFDVGADLCVPLAAPASGTGTEGTEDAAAAHAPLRVTQAYVDDLEAACDTFNAELSPLRSFILPGGSVAAAHLHVARTVCRRAERAVWAAIAVHGTEPGGGVNRLAATYLNRLSDLLFILCRQANLGRGGDVLWTPGGGRPQP